MNYHNLKRTITALIAAVCIATGSIAVADATPVTPDSPNGNVHFLYTQTAKSALIAPTGAHSKWAELTLLGVNNSTVWMSDRPTRKAGAVSTSDFVAAWKQGNDSFKVDSPNATIVFEGSEEGHDKQKYFVLELRHPVYNASMGTLNYEVRSLDNQQVLNKQYLKNVSVFIDSGCGWFGC